MTNYLNYVMVIGLASLSVAAVTCVALWLAAPLIFARGRNGEAAPAPAGPAPAAPARRGLVFDFEPSQAPAIAALLANESPEDTAVVVSRLPRETAAALLAVLDPDLRVRVLMSLAVPRPADMELLRGVRDELESRLYGTIGGPEEAASFVRAMPYQQRKAVLQQIAAQDPEGGGPLRDLFILDEDLEALSDKDVRSVAASVQPENMGKLLPALPEKLRARLKGEYKAKAALALEKAVPRVLKAGEKDASLAAFVEIVEKLSAKGVIARPRMRPKPAAAAAQAAPSKDDWG